MEMFEFIKNFKMKYPYKYIPPCPRCGSRCTGRYIREPLTESDIEYIEKQSLKHGEIVRFLRQEPTENAFCVDCGYRWGCTAKTIYLTKDEINIEIEERGTQEAYNELKEEIINKDLISGKKRNNFL